MTSNKSNSKSPISEPQPIALAGGGTGSGAVGGLCRWLLLPWGRHRPSWRKSVAVAAGVAALLLPVVAARVIAGVPVAGSRYSQELGVYYSGGLVGRIIHVAPHGVFTRDARRGGVIIREAPRCLRDLQNPL